MFGKIINSPWVTLASGFILAASSGYEAFSDLAHARPGAHHGVFVYGVVMALRALPDVYRGLKEVDQGLVAHEKEEAQEQASAPDRKT